MRHPATETLKRHVRPALARLLYPRKAAYDCPVCGYHGPFKDKRVKRVTGLVRQDSKCLGCGAAERHRMLHLVINDVLGDGQASDQKVLHFAPEWCLKPQLTERFGTYHTADLYMPGVDYVEDLQQLSFPDASYDCIVISRCMACVPDVRAAVRELRRVLAPDGLMIVSEAFVRDTTEEYEQKLGEWLRAVGLDTLDLFAEHFTQVERIDADRYDARFQLLNRMTVHGEPDDRYPESTRVAGVGYRETVALCRA